MLAAIVIASSVAEARSSAENAINLSWNDCGTHGQALETFACNTNLNPGSRLIGSFLAPDFDEFIGMRAQIELTPDGGVLPDWWKHGTGGLCRSTNGMTASFDFTSGPGSCADFFQGLATGGYAVDHRPDRATIYLSCGVPYDNRGPLVPGTEYYAFQLNVLHSRTTGTGSCAGCSDPMRLELVRVELMKYGDIDGLVLTGPLNRNWVRWQGPNVDVGFPGAVPLAVSRVVWNTDGRAGRVAFDLPRAGAATLELFDVAGRSRGRETFDGLGPGRHDVTLTAPRALASGVYFVRLTHGGAHAERRLVFTR